MPYSKDPDLEKHDMMSIYKVADSPEEKNLALQSCLNSWSDEPIGKLERRDDTAANGWHGWQMWRAL